LFKYTSLLHPAPTNPGSRDLPAELWSRPRKKKGKVLTIMNDGAGGKRSKKKKKKKSRWKGGKKQGMGEDNKGKKTHKEDGKRSSYGGIARRRAKVLRRQRASLFGTKETGVGLKRTVFHRESPVVGRLGSGLSTRPCCLKISDEGPAIAGYWPFFAENQNKNQGDATKTRFLLGALFAQPMPGREFALKKKRVNCKREARKIRDWDVGKWGQGTAKREHRRVRCGCTTATRSTSSIILDRTD